MTRTIAKYIDHTLLKPEATKADIQQLIHEAKTYQFASVCVNPYWVPFCFSQLKDTDVKVCTVIGFPLGAVAKETKRFETEKAIEQGALEVDMVLNIGELKSGNHRAVYEEIVEIVQASRGKALTKVIIETALLTDSEKVRACRIAKAAGADFVKTSTGFSTSGATVNDVKLMRQIVGEEVGVKAAGGIRNYETLQQYIDAGATRIGASAGVSIMKEYNQRTGS